ncbi:hypothetical protein [Peribacillus glennii]|uniref:Uncharacterized protein n=1 Tax=Peribacillus glennii TaxID=2303991 RepID=A0A372LHI1_9BACI|nr:hypothetical protein [Peribacillus glennii]RFU65066.1 hypothetical protein D0466_03895 [Peribacillus glennii]
MSVDQMSIDQLEKLLEELFYFKDVEITHTFSENQKPIISVIYKTQHNEIEITPTFQVTYIESQKTEMYIDVKSAANAIDKALNNKLETSTN